MILLKMVNPTGLNIRGLDVWGSGSFGAPRKNHVHQGVDFICVPGQAIFSPINGLIVREAHPYADDLTWSGCLIRGQYMEVKMFYLNLYRDLIGLNVTAGQTIGKAQDISLKYPGITPHVHAEAKSLLTNMINPEELLP